MVGFIALKILLLHAIVRIVGDSGSLEEGTYRHYPKCRLSLATRATRAYSTTLAFRVALQLHYEWLKTSNSTLNSRIYTFLFFSKTHKLSHETLAVCSVVIKPSLRRLNFYISNIINN